MGDITLSGNPKFIHKVTPELPGHQRMQSEAISRAVVLPQLKK